MRLFLLSLQFLTIIPLPSSRTCCIKDMGKSMICFPLAGGAISLILAALYFFLNLFFKQSITSALLTASMAIVTGALHLDGLADVFDGFAARGDKERFLKVMKDSCIGAAGAAAVSLILLIKWSCLASIRPEVMISSIIMLAVASRTAQVMVIVGSRHARDDGLGNTFIKGAGKKELYGAIAIATVLAAAIDPARGLGALAVSALIAYLVRFYFHKRLGGITGDIVGFTNEISETVVLLIFAAQIT